LRNDDFTDTDLDFAIAHLNNGLDQSVTLNGICCRTRSQRSGGYPELKQNLALYKITTKYV